MSLVDPAKPFAPPSPETLRTGEALPPLTDPSKSHSCNIPVDKGGERPVTEFPNTPLEEAVSRGHVGPVPDNAATLTEQTPATPAPKKKRNKLVAAVAAIALTAGVGAGYLLNSGSEDNTKTEVTVPSEPLQLTSADVYLGNPEDGTVQSDVQIAAMFEVFSKNIETAINTGDTRYFGAVFASPEVQAEYKTLSCGALTNGTGWNQRFTQVTGEDTVWYEKDAEIYGKGQTVEVYDDIFKGDPTVKYPVKTLDMNNFRLSVQRRPKDVLQDDGSVTTENIWMIVDISKSHLDSGAPIDCEY